MPGRECATLKSFLRADTEESDATLHQWRISGSDQLGAHIGKRFMGKMYLVGLGLGLGLGLWLGLELGWARP